MKKTRVKKSRDTVPLSLLLLPYCPQYQGNPIFDIQNSSIFVSCSYSCSSSCSFSCFCLCSYSCSCLCLWSCSCSCSCSRPCSCSCSCSSSYSCSYSNVLAKTLFQRFRCRISYRIYQNKVSSNIRLDPLQSDTTGSDIRLSPISSMIDTGCVEAYV
jgi:hypothetical protein